MLIYDMLCMHDDILCLHDGILYSCVEWRSTNTSWHISVGMGYLWLNGWGSYQLMGGAFMAYWVGHL